LLITTYPAAEFKEFERRLKYDWFHLKSYSWFQDLSRRSIEKPDFGGFKTRLKFIKFGHWLGGPSRPRKALKLNKNIKTCSSLYSTLYRYIKNKLGWFRIIFSVDPAALKAGLTRIRDLLITIKPQK